MTDRDRTTRRSASAGERCRYCGKGISASDKTFPFCSARCRTADLGKWATESYRISRPVEEADLDEEA